MEQIPISKNNILKSEEHKELLYTQGYFIQDFANGETVDALIRFYEEHHHFEISDGGNFWSIYSQNEQYKRETHNFIEELLFPIKQNVLTGYKSLINAFVVKVPGIRSSFNIHQDTTAMDETLYSPLSIWIPLCDVDVQNGCLCLIPFTHHYTSYERAVSISSSFKEITSLATRYALPIKMKAGQALFFDNRVLHFSPPNFSNTTRVAVVCGIMPVQAKYINCYNNGNGEVEIYEQDDDFIFSNPYFLKNSADKPVMGKLISTRSLKQRILQDVDWEEICKRHQLLPQNKLEILPFATPLAEPRI